MQAVDQKHNYQLEWRKRMSRKSGCQNSGLLNLLLVRMVATPLTVSRRPKKMSQPAIDICAHNHQVELYQFQLFRENRYPIYFYPVLPIVNRYPIVGLYSYTCAHSIKSRASKANSVKLYTNLNQSC